MPTALGITVGTTTSVAVSTTPSGTHDALVRRTALEVAPGREPALAAASNADHGSALEGFTARVGDPVALVTDDGRQFSGEELYAIALAGIVDETGVEPDAVVVACPNGWQAYAVDAVRSAADAHGLSDITIVPEAIAAVAAAEAMRGEAFRAPAPSHGAHAAAAPEETTSSSGLVAVYDLGGSSLDITLVRTGEASQILGRPQHTDEISGAAFDQALLAHVVESVDAADAMDPFDPATITALEQLRERCARAKEALSSETDTVVTVDLPGVHTDIRVVRDEVEDLLREPILTSLTLLRETVAAGGHSLRDLSAVVLTGGGAAIPLVTEVLSGALRVPVVADADPTTTSAFGAAVLASEIASASATLDAMPANAAAATAELAAARSARVAPAPRTTVVEKTSMGRTKRLAVIGGAAVAIAALTAGGLSLGTALSQEPAGSTTATTPSSAPSASSAAPASSEAAPSASASNPTGRSEPGGSRPAPRQSGQTGQGATGGSTGGGTQPGGTGGGAGSGTGATGGGTQSGGTTGGGTAGNGGTSGGSTGGGTSGGTGGGTGGGTSPGTGSGNTPPETGGGVRIPTAPNYTYTPPKLGLSSAPGAIVGGAQDTVGGVGGALGGLLPK
jgi:actin-like ATPase involved in cell morphogenesis